MKKFLKIWFLTIISLVSYGSIFHGLPGWDVFSIDQTFAQDSTEKTFSNLTSVLQLGLRLVYVLIWPLLVIAGQSMDNTFVYGSIFQLDAPLWKMRNLMKNFANFFLGFFMLYQILKFVFWQNKEADIKKVITSTLIAWVAIQASWFLLAALIDLSTIATYAIGSLPVTVLKNTDLWKKPLLSEDADIDMKDILSSKTGNVDFRIEKRYGEGEKSRKIAQCFLSWWNIIGVRLWDNSKFFFWSDYKNFVSKDLVYHTDICYISNNDVVFIDSRESIPYIETKDQISEKQKWRKILESKNWLTLDSLMKASKSYVGPMVVLYSSLLDFSSMNVAPLNNDFGGLAVEFIIKMVATLALVIPIVLMAIVLIVRVGALWLMIAFSPIIALKWSFKDELKTPIDDKLKMEYVLSIVFAPVMAVFALSMSIVFLSVIQESMLTVGSTGQPNFEKQLGMTLKNKPWNQLCMTTDVSQNEFCMKMWETDTWWSMYLNYFNWMIINLFAIGLMWTLFFAVMSSIELTKGFVDSVKWMGENLVKSTPIPVPWFGAASYNAITKTPDLLKNKYEENTKNADNLVSKLALYNVGASKLDSSSRKDYLTSHFEDGKYTWDFMQDIRKIYKTDFDSLGIKDQKELYEILKDIGLEKFKDNPANQSIIKGFEPLVKKMSPEKAKQFIENNETLASAWHALDENKDKKKIELAYEENNEKKTWTIQLDRKDKKIEVTIVI